MAEERVPCMSCREPVSTLASVCPNCGGMPRPLKLKDPVSWGCVIPMALVIAFVVYVLVSAAKG